MREQFNVFEMLVSSYRTLRQRPTSPLFKHAAMLQYMVLPPQASTHCCSERRQLEGACKGLEGVNLQFALRRSEQLTLVFFWFFFFWGGGQVNYPVMPVVVNDLLKMNSSLYSPVYLGLFSICLFFILIQFFNTFFFPSWKKRWDY